ncbi:MAG: hydroxymethylbilane synthase [Oscillospiraceae bacterium]|nr:hydroxymethylbilane synthase [Oscillospiraceae bacterium]
MKEIVIATRGSRLALAQTEFVRRQLENGGVSCKILTVKTKGDRDRTSALSSIGGNGLFVREVEAALLDGEADLAVHSAKDLPYVLSDGLTVPCVMEAADSRDCLVTVKGKALGENPVIGTGSARRKAQASRLFPSASFQEIRGNVDTRLQKLLDGGYDGIILAKAGLDRLEPDLSPFDVRVFSTEEMLPAACQGIIAVECRKNDTDTFSLLSTINDKESFLRFKAERTMLSLLDADCKEAVGVHSEIDGDIITVIALYEGKKAKKSGGIGDYQSVCRNALEEINEQQ